jgi:hypothetical protein
VPQLGRKGGLDENAPASPRALSHIVRVDDGSLPAHSAIAAHLDIAATRQG